MALNLSELKFSVNTQELEDAASKIKALGTEVGNLSKSMSGLTKETAASAKAQSVANLNNAKAEEVLAKAILSTTKAEQISSKAAEAKEKVLAKTTKNVKDADAAYLGLSESLTRTRDLMSESWTRGEANQIKMAESAGLVGSNLEYVKSILKDIGALSSSPFDNSIGAVRAMNKEFEGLVLRSKLVSQGIELNNKQLTLYARLAAEASVEVKKIGLDPSQGEGLTQYNKILKDSQDEFVKIAVANKEMLDSEKLLGKQHRETASAKSFLIKEDERMLSVQDQMNTGTLRSISISEKAALATANYARNLKLAGVNGTEAASRLAKYSAMQKDVAAKEEARVAGNLSRALMPQVTDVAVSLWSGQSPLTVLLQQGGQVVDMFKLSGLEASKLGETMKSAMKGMIPSIAAVGGAVGGLLVDGMKGATSAIGGFVAKMTGVPQLMELARKSVIDASSDFDSAASNVAKLDKVFAGVGAGLGVGIGASLVMLTAMAVAAYQSIQVLTDLSKAIVSVGASYGLTRDQIVQYSESIAKSGITTNAAIGALTEMIKAGAGTASSLVAITEAAMNLEKYGGQAVAETAKEYAKLKDDPVKALSELRINTGLVTEENMRNVTSLVEQGKEISAVEEATRILMQAQSQQAQQLKDDLNPLQQLWIDMKSTIADVWDEVSRVAQGTIAVTAFRVIWETVSVALGTVLRLIGGISTSIAALLHGDFKAAGGILIESIEGIGAAGRKSGQAIADAASGVKAVQDAGTKARQAESKAETDRLKYEVVIKKFKEDALKDSIKTSSKQQYVNDMIAKQNKLIGEGSKLKAEDEAFIRKQLGAQWQDAQKKPTKSNADKEAERIAKSYASSMQSVEKATNLATKAEEDYTNAQRLALDIFSKPEFLKYSDDQKRALVTKLETVIAVEQQIEAEKRLSENNKERLEFLDAEKKIQEEQQAIYRANSETITQETTSLALRQELLGKTDEEQKKINESYATQNKLTQIDLKYSKQRLDLQAKYLKLQDEKGGDFDYVKFNEEMKRSVEQQGQEAKLVWDGVAQSAAEDYQKEMKAISGSITDIIVTALFEGGKAGSQKIKDALKASFKNAITVQVNAVVNASLSSLTSAGKASGGTGTGSAVSDLLSGVSSFLPSGISAGFGALGGGYAAGSALGTSAIMPSLTMIGEATGLTSLAAGVGQLAGALGPVALGIGAIMQLAKSLDDSGTYHTGALSQYSAAGGTASSQTHGAFGMGFGGVDASAGTQKLTESLSKGIVDILDMTATTFGKEAGYKAATAFADDSSGDGAWGGLLISQLEKTIVNWDTTRASKWAPKVFSDGEAGMQEYLSSTVASVKSALIEMQLPDWAEGYINALGSTATLDELGTVVQMIQVTKEAFNSLGEVFPGLINMSDAAQSSLLAASGGIGALATTATSFYDNFFTEDEKLNRATAKTSEAFGKLGIVMPEVNSGMREWYKQEVLRAMALDQSVPANAKATVAILNLQGAVNDIAPAFDSAVSALSNIEDALGNTESAYDKLEKSINLEKQALQNSINSAKEARDALKGIFDTLSSSINSIYGNVTSTSNMLASSGRALITSATKSGVMPDQASLTNAIAAVNAGMDDSTFATKVEADRSRLAFANDLEKLRNQAGKQLSTADKQLLSLEKQVTYLDGILTTAKSQLDFLAGIDSGVISLKDALLQFAESIKLLGSAKVEGTPVFNTQDRASVVSQMETLAKSSGVSTDRALYELAKANNYSPAMVDKAMGFAPGTSESWIKANNLPMFANGGSYQGGMALVGETGPELINFSNPGQVYTSAQTSSLMSSDNTALVSKLDALTNEVILLRSEARATAVNTSRLNSNFERSIVPTTEGDALLVKTAV